MGGARHLEGPEGCVVLAPGSTTATVHGGYHEQSHPAQSLFIVYILFEAMAILMT